MKDCRSRFNSGALATLFALILLSGCPTAPSSSSSKPGSSTDSGEASEQLLETFDPPSWEDLNAEVNWEDQPVANAMDRYLEYKRQHPAEVSVQEALQLKNTSPENNAKILSGLGIPPASDADVDYEAVANRHSRIDVKSTNPIFISSISEFDLFALTGVQLISYDWELIPFGDANLIESWQSSEDRMYDKIVLRDDLVWSDGEPITAHDVAFTFRTIMDPRVPVAAVRSGVNELKWVEAYDDRTVVYFHKRPSSAHTESIGYPILPQHIYEASLEKDPTLTTSDYHLKYENQPVCGGPYKLVSRTRSSEFVLERREDWYRKGGETVRRKPYFRQIRFRIIEDPNTALLALKNGEIDELELSSEQWVSQTNGADFYERCTKASGNEWTFGYIGWNIGVPFFEDKRVRQALAYALDHKEMLDNILFGMYQPGQGIFHPTAWMAADPMPEPYQRDLDKAEALLDEAGWDDSDGDGIRDKEINGRLEPFQFTMMVPSASETGLKIAEMYKGNLDQIGIICDIKPTEFTVMQENAGTHKFQALMAAFGTGTDPSTGKNLWTTTALEQDGRNYSQYSNPDVDRWFEEAEKTFDREERAEYYGKIHTQLWEDQPFLWLYYRSSFYGFNKDLRGYMFSPRNPYGYAPGFLSVWKPKAK